MVARLFVSVGWLGVFSFLFSLPSSCTCTMYMCTTGACEMYMHTQFLFMYTLAVFRDVVKLVLQLFSVFCYGMEEFA